MVDALSIRLPTASVHVVDPGKIGNISVLAR